MNNLTIAIDIDEVMAALHDRWLQLYRADYDDTLTSKDITHWNIEEIVKPECGHGIFKYLDDPTLYHRVEPIEGALEGVNALRQMGHRIVFATCAHPDKAGHKYDWLIRQGFLPEGREHMKDYAPLMDKSLLACHILVDDFYKNFEEFGGHAILFKRPHNQNRLRPLHQAEDWKHLVDIIKHNKWRV